MLFLRHVLRYANLTSDPHPKRDAEKDTEEGPTKKQKTGILHTANSEVENVGVDNATSMSLTEDSSKVVAERCNTALAYLCLVDRLHQLLKRTEEAGSSAPPAAAASVSAASKASGGSSTETGNAWSSLFHPALAIRPYSGDEKVEQLDDQMQELSTQLQHYFEHDLVQAAADENTLARYFMQLGVMDKIRSMGYEEGKEHEFVAMLWSTDPTTK